MARKITRPTDDDIRPKRAEPMADVQRAAYEAARRRAAEEQRQRLEAARIGKPVPRRFIPEAEPGKTVFCMLPDEKKWPGAEIAARQGAAAWTALRRVAPELEKAAAARAGRAMSTAAARSARAARHEAIDRVLLDEIKGMARRGLSASRIAALLGGERTVSLPDGDTVTVRIGRKRVARLLRGR